VIRNVDTLIVGGGQAGLATAYHLKQNNKSFLIVEKHQRLGDNWRKRYDSLVLFATRRYSYIPGLKMSGHQSGYPDKNEVADYMENYAQHFEFPLALGSEIVNVIKEGDRYLATYHNSNGDSYQVTSSALVIATGGFQVPNLMKCASNLSSNILQLTPESYRRPSQVPSGTVLVVGDGATGRQVAKELSRSHKVILATGTRRQVKPQQIFGKDYFWWLDKLGLLNASKDSLIGRYMQTKQPFPGRNLSLRKLRKSGIQIEKKVRTAVSDKVYFENGNVESISSVIWAIGYHCDYSWLKLTGVLGERGELIEERGVSKMEAGLYCIGKPWQWTRGSATLTGVGADAQYIVESICEYLHESETKECSCEQFQPV
jgi:putative flavoprotein involved in K+ transport